MLLVAVTLFKEVNQLPKCSGAEFGGDTSGGDVQVWVVSDGGWWLPRTYTLARGGAGCGLTQEATTRGHSAM